jgi:LPS export ABC transporter protein LptC
MLFVFMLQACGEKVNPGVLPAIDSNTLPQQESWNSRITISDSGVVRAIIDAGYFSVPENSQRTNMSRGVHTLMFDRLGNRQTRMTSEEAAIDENTNNLEAHKNVVVWSEDSTELRTEELYWDNHRQLIYTPAFVTITSPKERLQGHGFESDQYLRNYKIFRVTGETRAE